MVAWHGLQLALHGRSAPLTAGIRRQPLRNSRLTLVACLLTRPPTALGRPLTNRGGAALRHSRRTGEERMKRVFVTCAASAFWSCLSPPEVQTCGQNSDCGTGAICSQGLCQAGEILPTKRALSVVVSGDGSVRSTPAGIDCGTTCKASFVASTEVSLASSAASGSRFVSWGGACSGSSDCNVKLSDDAQVFATFEKTGPKPVDTFRVTIAPAGTGTGKVTSGPAGIDCPTACVFDFNKGATVTLTAAAAAGSHFSGWSGACSGTADCKASADANITAKFDSDCDGLKPNPAGAALTFQTSPVTQATFIGCEPGTADGSGNLALSFATTPAPGTWHYSFLDPGGTVLGKADFPGLKTVIAQLAGYEGVVQQGSPILYQLGKDGKVVKSVTLKGASRAFNDPSGGVVVYEEDVKKHFEAYDASANLRWNFDFTPETGFNTLGVDRQGHVLVLFDG